MKKIAYISVYRDGTGYGNAACAMIQSVSKAGYNVKPIWITLNGHPNIPNRSVSILESSELDNVDVVIQQCLPSMFVRIAGVKNIGYFFWETDRFTGSGWQNGCNIMDEIWVNTQEQKEACERSGVLVPIKIVDQPKNLDVNRIASFNFEKYNLKNQFKFYSISDFSNKKNVNGLVHSFLSEFSINDNVCLVLKTYISRYSVPQSKEEIKKVINQIKQQMGKKPEACPKILLIPNMLSDYELQGLENDSHCFVSMSRGEGDGFPIAQAYVKGKPVIAPNISGIKKNTANNSLLIKEVPMKKVFGMQNDSNNTYYMWDENWHDPCSKEMCEKMRYVYENYDAALEITQTNQQHIVNNFSIDACAEKLRGSI